MCEYNLFLWCYKGLHLRSKCKGCSVGQWQHIFGIYRRSYTMSLKRILDFFGSKSPQTKIFKTNQEETGSSYCMSVSAEVTPTFWPTPSSAAGATEELKLPLLTQEVTLAAPFASFFTYHWIWEAMPAKFKFFRKEIWDRNIWKNISAGWFPKWQWLHYVPDKNCVFCFVCCKAREKSLRTPEDFARQPPSLPITIFPTCIWHQ